MSVCLSVCHTLVLYQNEQGYSPAESQKTRFLLNIRPISKTEVGHPERRHLLFNFNKSRSRYNLLYCDFRHLNRRISETVQDTTKITIDH